MVSWGDLWQRMNYNKDRTGWLNPTTTKEKLNKIWKCQSLSWIMTTTGQCKKCENHSYACLHGGQNTIMVTLRHEPARDMSRKTSWFRDGICHCTSNWTFIHTATLKIEILVVTSSRSYYGMAHRVQVGSLSSGQSKYLTMVESLS